MTIKNGTMVEYFGSLTQYHGVLTVVGYHAPLGRPLNEHDTIRYRLAYGPDEKDVLVNVRPGSFMVVSDE